MKIFVSASTSSQVNYDTGDVFPEYKAWLEDSLKQIEGFGHTVFCSLRADDYKINDSDSAGAFLLDEDEIKKADGLIAFVSNTPSVGVATEVGIAVALQKKVVFAHSPDHTLAYFNNAMILAGRATQVILPLTLDPFVA